MDPNAVNYGRANRGQLAPRQSQEMQSYQQKQRNPMMAALQGGTAEMAQQQEQPEQPQESPMQSALARPSVMPRRSAPTPPQGAPMGGDMSQGQLTPMASQMSPPSGKPMSTHNQAYQQLQQLQRQQAPPPPVQSQQAPPAPAPMIQQQPQQVAPQIPQGGPVNPGFAQNPIDQRPQAQPVGQMPTADTAYGEYLQEMDEGEAPMSYQQFEALFSQIPPDQLQAMLGQEEQQAAPQQQQFARQGFNGMNLDMVGQQGASPMGLLGFNTERAFAGGDENSMKDALGRAFSTNGVDLRGKSKEEVGAYLASPEFETHLAQSGLQKGVHWDTMPGEYDRIMVNSAERGWEPVDIVGNAGSGDAVWTYQASMDQQGQPQGNPLQGALMQGVDPTTGLPLQPGTEDPSDWEAILAQLQADMDQQKQQNPNLFTGGM